MSGCICGNGKGWYPTEDGREKYCTCAAAARAMIRDGVMRIRNRGRFTFVHELLGRIWCCR